MSKANSDSKSTGINIGIDLGTTNSCVAYQNHSGEVEILANDQGYRTTPSYVTYTNNERLVGVSSKNVAITQMENTVYDAKRLIGRKFSDKQTQEDIKNMSYTIINKNDQPYIKVKYLKKTHEFLPEEISSVILAYLKDMAEKATGETVVGAVITVPAYFNDSQRQATTDAGKLAGLNVLRIINEPTAAAMAYGLNKKDQPSNILVFDLGGGTFDVSLLKVNPKHGLFKVLATAGDTHLGGEDFDNLLVKHLAEQYEKKTGVSVKGDVKAMRKLKTSAEEAKRQLSSSRDANIDLSYIGSDSCSVRLSRAKFNILCASLFKKCLDPVKKVLADAGKDKDEIDEIVMVGGSSRIPKVQETISEFFDGKKLNLTINPDEAVAYGAAVQASSLSGQEGCKDILLLDVTPLSLGLETRGGVMDVVIPRQTTIPRKETKSYSTAKDNQTTVLVKVYEGERKMTKDNNELGTFELSGIPPMARHAASITVTFNIDANGILSVTATEKSTKAAREIVISNNKGRLSGEELAQKIKEAETFKLQDEEAKSQVKERNDTEEYLENVLESVETVRGLSEEDKKTLRDIHTEGFEWLEGENGEDASSEEIKTKRHSLEKKVMSIYKKANAASGQYTQDEDEKPDEEEEEPEADESFKMEDVN